MRRFYFAIPVNDYNRFQMFSTLNNIRMHLPYTDKTFEKSMDYIANQLESFDNSDVTELFFGVDEKGTLQKITNALAEQQCSIITDYSVKYDFISSQIKTFISFVSKKAFMMIISPQTKTQFNNFELFSKWFNEGLRNKIHIDLYQEFNLDIIELYHTIKSKGYNDFGFQDKLTEDHEYKIE